MVSSRGGPEGQPLLFCPGLPLKAKTAEDRRLLELIEPVAESLGLDIVRVRLMGGTLRRRLQIAADEIDLAAIFTIHGFCTRVLREHALESGHTFAPPELLASDRGLREALAADLWRVHASDPQQVEVLTRLWNGPDALAADLGVPLTTAGLLVSLYALAITLGAPTVTALTGRLPRRGLAIGLMTLFTLGNLVAAIAPERR